ncbi:hypothetical protein [Wielerella bovis]|uniref:hypothetical protein n=1 Tax=Wielerella bovis TaxID=2917790 RepID=UPI00201899CD|nr:hypothetical protein [Wielerella bovis]ULJ60610.1 hypothetical protein MIS44_01660 [Wielerella bovis]ULJ60620.1 hypothetical protein MIS44_01710 [Wielerella bovis]
MHQSNEEKIEHDKTEKIAIIEMKAKDWFILGIIGSIIPIITGFIVFAFFLFLLFFLL